MKRCAPWLAAMLAFSLACAPRTHEETPLEDPPLEVSEVPTPVFSTHDPDEDVQGVDVSTGLSGMLPSDFPSSFALPDRGSVEGFAAEGQSRSVTLAYSRPPAQIADELNRLGRSSGWSGALAGGAGQFERAGDVVDVAITPREPSGSIVSIRY